MKKQFIISVLGVLTSLQTQAAIVQSFGSSNWEYYDGTTWHATTMPFYWSAGSGSSISSVWVKTTINLTGYNAASASYYLGIDNGLDLYVKNTLIRTITHEGGAGNYDFFGPLTGATTGLNEIKLLVKDWGGATYFDMQISADLAPIAVPEPSTYLAGLSALGMLGLFGWRSRK